VARFDHLLEGSPVGEVASDLSVGVVDGCHRGFRGMRSDLCLVAEPGTTCTRSRRVPQDTSSVPAVQGCGSRNASQSRYLVRPPDDGAEGGELYPRW